MQRRSLLFALLALAFGSPTASPRLAPAETRSRRLIRIKKSDRELWYEEGGVVVRRFVVALGGAPVGDKEQRGDSRTPEGEFYVSTKNPNSAFHRFIGLSYPMPRHAERGRARGLIGNDVLRQIREAVKARKNPPQLTALGGHVGIHGGGAGRDWTLGCIAVSDEEATWLFERVRLGDPIVVEA